MEKKIIRLTENDLHNIVKESVKKIIKEYFFMTPGEDEESEAYLNNDVLADTNSDEEYYDELKWMKDNQRLKGEDAMDYHPQRNSSTIAGEDFASSYARDPSLARKNAIDWETERARRAYGFN